LADAAKYLIYDANAPGPHDLKQLDNSSVRACWTRGWTKACSVPRNQLEGGIWTGKNNSLQLWPGRKT